MHTPAFPGPDLSDSADPDPSFVFDYRPLDGPDEDQRFSTYWDVEPLMRGPEPLPGWLVTDRAALDTELGVLKTGKEADVFLLERAVPGTDVAMTVAAKRYRSTEHRTFHRSASYTEGRTVRNSRDARALNRKSTFGREVAAGEWAWAEWNSLVRCYTGGVPVPYPIQIDGTEILMELVTDGDVAAPRLAQTRPDADLLASYFRQLTEAMAAMSFLGIAHGDLSPYNILAAGERLVVIDLPQIVDVAANPAGADFLLRDCRNVCTWFRARGLDVDEHDLFADLMVSAFG
jgi:RIO kinase 1